MFLHGNFVEVRPPYHPPRNKRCSWVFETSQRRAESSPSIFVKVTASGFTGWGEATPVQTITTEDQSSIISAVARANERIKARPVECYRYYATRLKEMMPGSPSARAGIETAILDAAAKASALPLYIFLGGRPIAIETDVTIPLVDPRQAADLAFSVYKRGFTRLKVKVGSEDREQDLERILAVASAASRAVMVVDANEAFEPDEALSLIEKAMARGACIDVFEQPVPRDDVDGLAYITSRCPVPVFADESARTTADVFRLAKRDAVSGIVVKIMKSGFVEALDMALAAKSAGLDVMMGTMLESRIGQSASLQLAAAAGVCTKFDLDSDLLLAEQPVSGGFDRADSILTLTFEPGLGVNVELSPPVPKQRNSWAQ